MQAFSKTFRTGCVIIGSACAVGLASCGGGSSDNGSPVPVATTPPNTVPPSASVNVMSFIAYLKILVATQPENTEPLDTTGFVAPTSDTTEPDPTV